MAQGGVPETHGHARLQAEIAAALERADRAEVQLRTATEESSRLSDRVELLHHELADAKRDLAKSREETVAVTALAATHGARAVELDREATGLREKSYQLEMDIATLGAERDRLRSELAGTYLTINDVTAVRSQLANQLEDAAKQLARSSAGAAAAEDRCKAEMQQLQLRLATSEAEFRALNHAKGTMHEDLQRARGEILALQAQLQEESRQREDQASECRRLQRELESVTEALVQVQRLQRSGVTKSEELEEELGRLRSAHLVLEADMQTAMERTEKLQEEVRLASERNAELVGQVNGLTANLRHLEVENARLTDGQAMLKVELEARAAEARAARGEAAELAADRARLLAAMQQQKSAAAEEELSRLRDALAASRVEVARLQKELTANDVVLADAESALVALVSEKEGLKQALNAALTSERVAIDAVEELKSQVATLASQEVSAQGTTGGTAADRAETLASASGVDQRMISYLQSLSDTVATVGPSESGHEQSGAATPAVVSSGPGSTASSMAAAATAASVRVAGPGAQPPLPSRYPVHHALSASGSGSYRPPGNNDAWETMSASGTDRSRKENSSVDDAAASAPAGVPSATSLVVASLSLAMGTQPELSTTASAKNVVELPILIASATSVTGASGNSVDAALPSKGVRPTSPRRVTSTGRSNFQEEGIHITGGGTTDDTTSSNFSTCNSKSSPRSGCSGASPTVVVTNVVGTANVVSSAPRISHLPPRSPQRSDIREHEDTSSSEPSLGHGDISSLLQPSVGPNPMPGSAAAGSIFTAASKTQPQSRPLTSSVLPDFTPMPPAEAYRTPARASINLSPYQSVPPASTASGTTSPAGGYTTATSSGPSPGGATGASVPAASTFREPDMPASPRLSRTVVSADTGSMLQSNVYRSPMRVSLIAPRTGATEGNDRASATSYWQPGLGATAAGSSSPMISPRVMLETRMLSRAVRPSADALSSPLRTSGIIPSFVASGEPGVASPQLTPSCDSSVIRGPSVPTSASSQNQQHNRPQQHTLPLSHRKVAHTVDTQQPDASTFPSPFASGNAAAVVASPRTSGAVGVLSPSSPPPGISAPTAASPRTSGTVDVTADVASPPPPSSVASLEFPTRHISQEQQHSDDNRTYVPRTSFSLAVSRRTTLTQGAGLVGAEAISAPVPTTDDRPVLQSPKPMADKVAVPTVKEASPTVAYVNPALLPPAPSEEDEALLKRLAAMDDALRAIGAI
ncbi:hypothetical protein Vretimale_4831 [Volvox reticuliferus]|uniref:Uncharacterized protein n=1 Tax=Volvox reticuliferus TaxID=1737510 RepID=A0A8J4C7J6_9CHLO|nr:hypothetical protein Vretifemale_3232 [Volvox reticuliferus]GIL99681.1 hypothetical protein Vretimale_4831 [Volvox reticuliferus]